MAGTTWDEDSKTFPIPSLSEGRSDNTDLAGIWWHSDLSLAAYHRGDSRIQYFYGKIYKSAKERTFLLMSFDLWLWRGEFVGQMWPDTQASREGAKKSCYKRNLLHFAVFRILKLYD